MDPSSLLSYPMSWRWVCANGHVVGGVDLGAGDVSVVEVLISDGKVVDITRLK